jgi:NAD(P)H-quinone oxidoreductase subunit 5
MMMADNLLVLVGGWSITSVGLHYLLTYYQNEPDAVVVARKKFLISRLGDIALLLAIFSIYRTWGTFSLTQFFDLLSKSNQVPEFSVWMICLAAILKSAQFPFHSWLPDTLAAPTPVSALMHAGIINGGGALLLKFAPALIRVPTAGLFLAVIGSITMAFGMVSMWSQTSVKRKLAWSTVSQMGFMTAELGMAAFAAALLHIVSHGLYKATAFLGSGEVEAASVTPNRLTGWKNLAVLIVGIILSMPLQIFAHGGHMTPQQWSIAVMTGIASGHFLIALQAHLAQRGAGFIITIASMIVSTQFIALLSSTLLGFATYCIHLPLPPASWPSLLAAIIPVITLALLSAFRAFEADIRRSDFGKALSVHAQNGFYVGLYADKAVAKIWTSFSRKAH